MSQEYTFNFLNGLVLYIKIIFSLKDLNSYDNLLEAINYVAVFLKDIVTTTDFTHIFNICYHNEKFMFMLLYPFLIKPLGKIVWVTLLPHFHFVSGSFNLKLNSFIQEFNNSTKGSTIAFDKKESKTRSR